ncbi:MAG: hypothetical protein ABS876_07530, partial [Ruminococcus sp.]
TASVGNGSVISSARQDAGHRLCQAGGTASVGNGSVISSIAARRGIPTLSGGRNGFCGKRERDSLNRGKTRDTDFVRREERLL